MDNVSRTNATSTKFVDRSGGPQVATHYVKNVPIAPNIPIAPSRQPVPWSALVVFLIVAAAIASSFISFIDWYTINRSVILYSNVSVHAILKNCGVSFSNSSKDVSYVTIRSWLNYAERTQRFGEKRLDETPLRWNEDKSLLKIRLTLTKNVKFLLCSVHFHLTPDFYFKNLKINYAPAQSYIDVSATVPVKARQEINIRALHGRIKLKSIGAPYMNLNIGDGCLQFDLKEDSMWYEANKNVTQTGLITRSRTAPISISSSIPLKVDTSSETATRSLIRSSVGSVNPSARSGKTKMKLSPKPKTKQAFLFVDVESDEGALYIDVEDALHSELNTWVGAEHLKAPHLLEWTHARLDNLKTWLEFEPFSPWIIELMEHRTAEAGFWRFLSSSAYLRGGNWFVLFSAGLLQPRQRRLQVHVMGIFCRSRDELELAPVIPDESVSSEDDLDISTQKMNPIKAVGQISEKTLASLHPLEGKWNTSDTLESYTQKIEEARAMASVSDLKETTIITDHQLMSHQQDLSVVGRFVGPTRHLETCQQETLADTFLVLYKAMEFLRTESTMIVYRNSDQQDIRFDVRNDAVVQDFITWGDIWFFVVAIFINVVFSGILASVGTFKFHRFCAQFLLDDFNAKCILCTASHRLDHEISKTEGDCWSLSVSRVYYPTSGFALRWNHEPGVAYNRYGIHIRPVDMEWMKESKGQENRMFGISSKDVYLYLPITSAKGAQGVVRHQRQLFLPFKNPGKVFIDCQQRYKLQPNVKYRFQLQAINAQGRVVDTSVWSPEVRPDSGLMFVDLPLLVLGRFCPVRQSSLEMFIQKFVVRAPLSVTNLRLNHFVLEIFSDVSTVKTTTRRRLLKGTMKMKQQFSSPPVTKRSHDGVMMHHPQVFLQKISHFTTFQLVLGLSSSKVSGDDQKRTAQTIIFQGIPEVVQNSDGSPRGAHSQQLVLSGNPSQFIFLTHSRITQKLLNCELSDGSTGRRLATGHIRIADIHEMSHQEKSSLGSQSMSVHIPLDHADIAGQWGRLTFQIVIPGLRQYERHAKLEDFALSHGSSSYLKAKTISGTDSTLRRRPVFSFLPIVSPLTSPVTTPRLTTTVGFVHRESYEKEFDIKTMIPLNPESRVDPSNLLLFQHPNTLIEVESSAFHFIKGNELCFSFVTDIPAAQYLEGTDMTISWVYSFDSSNSRSFSGEGRPDNIYLHLIDHATGQYLGPLHLGHPIPNTGTYSWTVEAIFDREHSVRSCFLVLSIESSKQNTPLHVMASSNTFFILKCLPLCEFEMCYAAFCRTHRLEMEHLSDTKLLENGIVTFEANVKVCPDLRHPVPFEPAVPCVHCPGQCVPSSVSKLVRLRDSSFMMTSGGAGVEGPINVYKAVTKKLKVTENCMINRDAYWWSRSPDAFLLQFDLPYHSILFHSWRSFLNSHMTMKALVELMCPTSILGRGHSTCTEAFRRLRYLEFKVVPLIIQIFVITLQLFWFAAIPLGILIGYIEYDRLLANFMQRPHTDIDANYIIDFVFNPSFTFIWSLRFPGPFIVLLSISWILFTSVVVIFSSIIRNDAPRLRQAAQMAGKFVQYLSTFLTLSMMLMFLLWLMLGALINSEGFLPYAVMSASIFFAVYTVGSSFSGAREVVAKYVEENLELLLSIAMGHWCDSSGTLGVDSRETIAQKDSQRKERFREKMKEARRQLLATKQTVDVQYDLKLTSSAFDFVDERDTKSRALRESICTYFFQKTTAYSGNVFVFVNGRLQGLEQETLLPVGTRMATVAEVEKSSQKIDNLLHGFEIACLADGVKYGPRFGNKVERHPENGSQYTIAIIAVPLYPEPVDVDVETKVTLIFYSFDKDEDNWLNEVELTMWQLILNKPEFENWDDTLEFYKKNYSLELDQDNGANLEWLQSFYKNRMDVLDKDYLRLFPQQHQHYKEMEEEAADDEVISSVDDGSDFEEELDIEDIEDAEDGSDSDGTTTALEDHEALDYRYEQTKIEEKLAKNFNSQQLQKIYQIVTLEQQERRFDRSNFPDSFLAMKILETQFSFVSPTFGDYAMLGGHPVEKIDEVAPLQGGLRSKPKPMLGDTIIELLKYVALESVQDLTRQSHHFYHQMFQTSILLSGISDFFDNIMTQRIQSKARHILNIKLDLSKSHLQKSSLEFLESDYPFTSFQVAKLMRRYRLSRDAEIRYKLADATIAGPFQSQIQVSIVVQTLIDVKVMDVEDIAKQYAEIRTATGSFREMTLWLPHRRECSQFLNSLIEARVGSQSSHLSEEDLAEVTNYLISNYLWLNAFLMLLQLMGFALPSDDLPGETPFLENERLASEDFIVKHSLSTESGIGEMRQRRNFARVKKVFDQLSNHTGFLPVDLADEAILLLTDNCVNYPGMVACLQHLNVGGVGKVGSESSVNTLLNELGFLTEAVCYDIGPSSDLKEDELDWTVYREVNWLTEDLSKTFYRLTAASPGFMGKSQMIEFIKEIEKSFREIVSTTHHGNHSAARVSTGVFGGEDFVTKVTADHDDSLITFEMYHKGAIKLGFSCSRAHSRMMWILFSNEAYGGVRQFLPAGEISNFTVRLFLQPTTQEGRVLSRDEGLEDATSFRGCLNLTMFRRFIRRLGVTISDKGIRNLWEDLSKDALEIVYRDSITGVMTTKYLRMEMDPLGFDPMKGRTLHVNVLKKELPRLLCSGLWLEALTVLFNLGLQLEISESKIEAVLDSMAWRMNRYGLLRPEDVVLVMSESTVEGVTFGMLRELLLKMRLRLPEQDVKRMFDLMDVNHDHTLDLKELLAGFEMLFQRFVPNQIIDGVGLSHIQQLYVTVTVVCCLLALFSFLGFAFTAFVGLRSGVSAAVQSVIALVGALGLQSGASESIERVQEKMKKKIAVIVGEDLDKKSNEQQEAEKLLSMQMAAEKKIILDKRPLELRYALPLRFRPNVNDPKLCATFYPGDEVFLAPQISGGPGVANLIWSLHPRMPAKTGLIFDTHTGVLFGTIPQRDDSNRGDPPGVTRQKSASPVVIEHESDDKAKMTTTLIAQTSIRNLRQRKSRQVWMRRRTFMVVCRNAAGAAKCRITFQIVPHARDPGHSTGKAKGDLVIT